MRGVVKIDRPKFQAALKDLRDLVATLTPEQIEITKMDDRFEWVKYENQFDIIKATDEDSEKNCRGVIEWIHEDLADHKEQQEWIAKGLSVPKILARFEKLPKQWQSFVKRRMAMEEEEDEKDLFEQMADIAREAEFVDRTKNRDETRHFIESFDKMIREVEDARKE